ncbi:signal peptidase I [Sphingomonas profundi]|uniref:signal peptidase I n=1 Tax=Alterirhizorhabdus profundi TaxID=2681549 RepID=UPI001E2B81FF|nr:signal peptidase I [Sphingomonas profundi]
MSRRKRADGLGENVRFFILLIVTAILVRSLFAAPFSIPSESMLPRLLVGDYLFVAKWPYGWSRHSFPFSLAPISGRIGGAVPARGDVIVFKTPADNRTDYIKRLIGLPGDQIRMVHGRLILNGDPVPKVRIADFLDPVSPNSPCAPFPGSRIRLERRADGDAVCRYPRYRETLPGGRSYEVLDLGRTAGDDTATFVVPADQYFLMGDNRDRSADSRFPAEPGGGIGFVPAENLVGRAWVGFFSTDGSAGWLTPWTWPAATRWNRIGLGF